MIFEDIKKKVEKYLTSDKTWPIIVDFSNRRDLKNFIYYFSVATNKKISAGVFCGNDGTIKFDELLNSIENYDGNILLVDLSGYLKLYGEKILKSQLKSIISKSIKGHVVIITYQCRNYVNFSDERFYDRGQILIADGEFDATPGVCFINPKLADVFLEAYSGFDKLGKALENSDQKTVYVLTSVKKQTFDKAIISVSQMSNGYDIICARDSKIGNIPESMGEPEQWNSLLQMMGNEDFDYVVNKEFGPVGNLINFVKLYPNFNEEKKWLYFITLNIMGINKDSYLSYVIANTRNYKDIPREVYRAILTIDKDDDNFKLLYAERKIVLKNYISYVNEIINFCKIVSSKQEEAIFYLTDTSEPEKEKIIEWLDIYGHKYGSNQLRDILRIVFPELASYLENYRFEKDFLNNYFEEYKYQKLINRILPSFEIIVEKQAKEHDFIRLLPARTQIFDKINLEGAQTYFFDALGVEYLGFIQSKCNEYGLFADISCAHSELPSLTSFNKDFLDTCEKKGCDVASIKLLDEIKHHGKENYDFEKVKIPVYLIKELEIIDDLLKKIQASIMNNKYDKAVIVSDHGASRLAVLHETENFWQMETKGVYSGRCCSVNEVDDKPDYAIEESGYWVLANYDRFKGSRKSNVEVHGGATLEEVAVPIIEITRRPENIDAFILKNDKIVVLAAKEVPKIKIYAGIISNNIILKIDNNYYDTIETSEKYIYEVELLHCTKKGIYYADIINGTDVLSTNNRLEIQKKGLSENNLFD